MSEPTISRDEDFATGASIYRLRIPASWLVCARWPRITLSWWLLKLVWRGPARKQDPLQ
jgi:hypothetical protein